MNYSYFLAKNLIGCKSRKIGKPCHKKPLNNRPFPAIGFLTNNSKGTNTLHSRGKEKQYRNPCSKVEHRSTIGAHFLL